MSQLKYVKNLETEFAAELNGLNTANYDLPGIPGQEGEFAIHEEADPDAAITGTKRYRELLGKLNYAMCWTRPDIATNLGLLARYQNNYYPVHWKALKHCAKYVINTRERVLRFSAPSKSVGTRLSPGTERDHLNLVGYVDADYAGNVENSKSRTGYVYMCCGAPIIWRSALQPVVAQSSCESEYISANACAREAEWCRLVYDELLLGNVDENGVVLGRSKEPVLLREDNQGCMALAKNFMITRRSKHIRVRFHYLRQQVRDSVIRFEYINTKLNTADLFTKVLPKLLFNRHRDTMVKQPHHWDPTAELIE